LFLIYYFARLCAAEGEHRGYPREWTSLVGHFFGDFLVATRKSLAQSASARGEKSINGLATQRRAKQNKH